MGTHSRSIAIVFPIPLKFSHIPNPITIAKIHGAFIVVLFEFGSMMSLLLVKSRSKIFLLLIRPGRRSAGEEEEEEEEGMGPGTRKIQPRQAKSTEARFAEIVMRRVRIRDGALSIHRPTKEDRHKAAKVVHNPLLLLIKSGFRLFFFFSFLFMTWYKGWVGRRGQAHRIDCANNVCGNADAVNKVLCIVVVAISYQDLMLRGGREGGRGN